MCKSTIALTFKLMSNFVDHDNARVKPFSVLFVCTGNICRSPIAEQLFRAYLDSPGIEYSSAGTHAAVEWAMPSEASDVSERLGGNPSAHSARQLSAKLIEQSDLVIALAREHRSKIVRTVPRASRYTFTLREFVRLLEEVTADSAVSDLLRNDLAGTLRELVPAVASRRGQTSPVAAGDDDVDDPFGRSLANYALAGEQINDAVKRVLQARTILESLAATRQTSKSCR